MDIIRAVVKSLSLERSKEKISEEVEGIENLNEEVNPPVIETVLLNQMMVGSSSSGVRDRLENGLLDRETINEQSVNGRLRGSDLSAKT